MVNTEELLEEAKRRYPIGTKYIGNSKIKGNHNVGKVVTATERFEWQTHCEGGAVYNYNTNAYVWVEGEWSQLIEDYPIF